MMNRNLLSLIATFLLILMLASCAQANESSTANGNPVPPEVNVDQDADTDDGQDADPEDSNGEENEAVTPAIDPYALFLSNCARCHSPDRSGDKGPSLLPDRLTGEASEYAETITNGRGVMPTWGGKLSADEINALSEWILTTPE
jgi:mono/diheme cytochrome c family protein